ncbi:MAG: threonine--tRNA ligase [Candidatus Marsarchaeota archaeon]|jgi:threonyl-tRNA synthetase|nr:threonine--tRNA ligase [Candidatus Marsarchaeota archaeon]
MKVLQLDVNSIEFQPIAPELNTYERITDSEKEKQIIKEALVLLISIEKEDTEKLGSLAIKNALESAMNIGRKNIVLYPFAHLSNNLENPDRAMKLMHYLFNEAKKSNFNIINAPFGWNKSLKIDIKGHPLAETLKNYNENGEEIGETKRVANITEIKKKLEKERRIDLSIVRKSEFVGLPDADHRIIGERLDLFSFQGVSPAMVYWHPNGWIIFNELKRFMQGKLKEYGYKEISTPIIANIALWHVSGHIDHYKDNMFVIKEDKEELGIKPMNCPSTILIYKSRKWSYRDLPVRFSIFDKLYRKEVSGSLSGLFRVQELTQDDAHIFLAAENVIKEITSLLKLFKEVYEQFKFEYKVKLSTMPDSHLGDEKLWNDAIDALKNALEANNLKYEIKEKEGAFYGPKIDFDIKDSMDRMWQCGTIQLDYQLPQRFNITYTGSDGEEYTPVIVHRAIYGSFERFIGILIEHYKGKFPTWLSPIQVRIIAISDQVNDYANSLYKQIGAEGIVRVELDISDKTLEYKIRDAQLQSIPYMIIIGKKEAVAKTISVRTMFGKQKNNINIEEFINLLKQEINERKTTNFIN